MDLSSQLMNQIRMQNEPQAQLIQQANQEADLLQHMPTQNPMGPAMMKFGLGILGAPPEMSTSQAMGLSGQEAMKTYEEHSQKQNQNRMQSIALRQTAANTIDAVRKFNMENEFKNRQMVNLEAQTAETKRHNQMSELLKAAENQANNPNNKMSRDHLNELLKKAQDYKKYESTLRNQTTAAQNSSHGVNIPMVGKIGEDISQVKQNNHGLPQDLQTEPGKSNSDTVRNMGTPLLNYARIQVVGEAVKKFRSMGYSDEEIPQLLENEREYLENEANEKALKIHEEESIKRKKTSQQNLNSN